MNPKGILKYVKRKTAKQLKPSSIRSDLSTALSPTLESEEPKTAAKKVNEYWIKAAEQLLD